MFIGHDEIFIFFRILTFSKIDRGRDDVTETQQTLFVSRNKVMKIFNFGACTSSETKRIKKEIKSINEQIKLIKQSKSGGANSPISSIMLNKEITYTGNRIAVINLDKLDAKHQGKVKNSEGYKKMEVGCREIEKIARDRNRANLPAAPKTTTKAEKSYLGVDNQK
ncbi:hypothetical protein AA909_15410 [Vibrio anguillarum]|nr:hypothetical protein AA909_15410 [Vibrio anguillarum]